MLKVTKAIALMGLIILISGVVSAQKMTGEDVSNSLWEQRQKWEGKSEKKTGGPMGAMGESGSTVKTKKTVDYGTRSTSTSTVTTSRSLPPELLNNTGPKHYGMFLAGDDKCYVVYFENTAVTPDNARFAEVDLAPNYCNKESSVNEVYLRNIAYDYVTQSKPSSKVKKIVGDNDELVSSAEAKGYVALHTDATGMTHLAKFVPGRNPAENVVQVGQVRGIANPATGPVSDLPRGTPAQIGDIVPVDHKLPYVQTPQEIAVNRADTQPAAPIIDKSVPYGSIPPATSKSETIKPMEPIKYEPVPYAKVDTIQMTEEASKNPTCVGGPKLKDGIIYDIKHLTQDLCDKMANEEFDRYCMLPKHCNFANKDCDVDACIEQYRKMKGRAIEDEYKKYDDAQDAYIKALNSERRAKVNHTKCTHDNPKPAICAKKNSASLLASAEKALKAARSKRDQAKKDMEASVKVKLEDKSGEYATSCMDSKSYVDFYPKFRQTLLVYQCKKGPFGTKPEDQKYKHQTPSEIRK